MGNEFQGTFDGLGHSISGIYMDGSQSYGGFFGYSSKVTTVKNLGIEKASIAIKDDGWCGGILARGDLKATNCWFSGSLKGAWVTSVGGMVGASDNVDITNCYFDGLLIPGTGNMIGGIAGNVGKGKIINCYSISKFSRIR